MKIAIIGYGKMGHIIENIALSRGHEIVSVIDKDNLSDFSSSSFASADVAIEFSTPVTAVSNIRRSWAAGVPVVSGTTGWKEQLPELKAELQTNGKALFWTSNFSVGVNMFFALNRKLYELMNKVEGYEPSITEIHHIHKLDAPSGTAVTLAEQICFPTDKIESIRRGEVPGTHIVKYDSAVDTLTITHEAHSREGFALGAVLAAEFIKGKKGFYSMQDMLNF